MEELNNIDLCHIEGLACYDSVKLDFETWLPKMSDRGVMIFHNTEVVEKDFGIGRLWNEISVKYPSFNFQNCNGIGILLVGKKVKKDLLNLSKDKNIRNQAWNTIYSKEDISIIVIGKESTPKLKKAKTNRIFVLDDLLLCDLLDIESGGAIKYYIKNRRLNFSKINFINLIYCFFETDNTKIIDVKKYTNFTTSNNWKTKLLN